MGRAGFILFFPGSAVPSKPTHMAMLWASPIPSLSAGLNFLPVVKPCSPLPEPAVGSPPLQQLWLAPSKTLFLHFS